MSQPSGTVVLYDYLIERSLARRPSDGAWALRRCSIDRAGVGGESKTNGALEAICALIRGSAKEPSAWFGMSRFHDPASAPTDLDNPVSDTCTKYFVLRTTEVVSAAERPWRVTSEIRRRQPWEGYVGHTLFHRRLPDVPSSQRNVVRRTKYSVAYSGQQ